MIVYNNLAAINARNILDRNTVEKNKSSQRISSGEKITAKDASSYAISEKMRAQIRTLDQNCQNVQNGASLLRAAEGGIQEQIDILKKIKETVVKASNGIYTSGDLRIMQQELDNAYNELQDIAVKTNFNGITMLMGGTPDRVVIDWAKLPQAEEVRNSQLNLIPGGIEPFSKVEPYELDFTGQTADTLKGKVFTYTDGDGNEKIFMFAEYDAAVPSGITKIPVSNYYGVHYTPAEMARSFAGTLTGWNELCYSIDGNKAQVYTDSVNGRPTNKPFTIKGLGDTFKTCNLDGTTPLDKDLSGGTAGPPATAELDFSAYNTADQIQALKGFGFRVYARNESGSNYEYVDYVFDDGTGKYPYQRTIDIRGISTATDLATKVSSLVSGSYFTDVAGGARVVLTTTGTGSVMNQCYIEGITQAASGGGISRPAASATGFGTGYFSGGVNSEPYADEDNPGSPGAKASISFAYHNPPVGSGFQFTNDYYPYTHYVRFVSGSGGPTYNEGAYQIGVDSFREGFRCSINGMEIEVSGGRVNFKAPSVGTYANSWRISSDGYPQQTVPANDEVKPLLSDRKNFSGGADNGNKATTKINISAFTDKADMIDKLAGTGFYFDDVSNGTTTYVEFVNSAETDPDRDAERDGRYANSLKIDLAGLPGVSTPQEELITLMMTANSTIFSGTVDNENIIVTCEKPGLKGNSSEVKTLGSLLEANEGASDYAKYPVDFERWMADNAADIEAGGGLVKYLTNKGFRTDCSTCPNQWFNFEFVDGNNIIRPDTNGDGSVNSDIHNYPIDISGVTDAKSLVQAIYDQGFQALKDTNHFMMMDVVKDQDGNPTGTLLMYDNRLIVDPDTRKPRADNAKIHDGVKSDWARADRALLVDTLYIQDMERSSMNLRVKVPRTTLDNIFDYNEEYHDISEYHLMTKESRDNLLGKPPTYDGEIDKGINYLVSSVTLVGSQLMRLEHSENNIVTKHENISSAESVIRDTNMAKEMTNFVKYNVLQQSAQFVLSQANQKMQSVLNLLQ